MHSTMRSKHFDIASHDKTTNNFPVKWFADDAFNLKLQLKHFFGVNFSNKEQ